MADVQEGAPTPDQLGNIIDYLGESKIGSVVSGATSSSDALRKLKADGNAFQRPVVVDWHNGRAGTIFSARHSYDSKITDMTTVVGDSESEILKLVRELPKEETKA